MNRRCLFGGCRVWTVLALGLALALGLLLPGRRASAFQAGSIEMTFPAECAGVELTLYAVADYTEEQTFVYRESFAGCGVDLLQLEDAQEVQQAAEQMAVLAKETGAAGTAYRVGEDGVLRCTELVPAWYLMVQTGGGDRVEVQKMLIPIPYTMEDGSLSYHAELSPKYASTEGAVILRKVDDQNAPVGQARFRLQRKVYVSQEGEIPKSRETGQDGAGRFLWEDYLEELVTDEYGQLALSDLPLGVYRFVETQAPDGYILNDAPEYFSIEKGGEIQNLNGIYQKASGTVGELSVINVQTLVKVSKVDDAGRLLAGAKLVVKDASGKVITDENGAAAFVFTTEDGDYELRRLPAGNYFLSELEAPEGYLVAKDVPFTVDGGADAVNTVTMVDEQEKKTTASLRVTKHLTDFSGYSIAVDDYDFYAALFADEGCTERVSNVKLLHFSGGSSTSAVFENLEPGRTYYVAETDEYGVLLESAEVDGALFAPFYPDGQAVTVRAGQAEFEFTNEFYDVPHNFYYGGQLTVTKQTIKNGDFYDTDEVFYAAVFHDKELTNRYSDVIELAMDGGSETSVTIPVTIGLNVNDSVTYYVAETDENGNPLRPEDVLGFRVTIDQAELVFSPQYAEQEVVIVNEFVEEQEESEDTPPQGGGGQNPPSSVVRTGDETPVALYLILLLLSAAAAAGVFAVRRRGR